MLAVAGSTFIAVADDKNLPEPENIGTVYSYNTTSNSLSALEKQEASVGRSGWPIQKIVIHIPEPNAPLRLIVGQKMVFVVSLPNGVDPSKYQLIRFDTKGKERIAVPKQATWSGEKSNPVYLTFNVGKFGDSYKFTPSPDLSAGEYGFSATDSNDTYCFGVDASDSGKN